MTDASPIAPTGTGDLIEKEAAAQIAELDCDWSAFGKSSLPEWDGGPDGVRDYRIGIATGRAIAAAIRALPPVAQDGEVQRLRKLDAEAATYIESVIVMRTDFSGKDEYVGWKGLGMSLNEALDERDALRADKAKLEALVETLAEALSAIDPSGKLDCELRANALAEYQKWKEGK